MVTHASSPTRAASRPPGTVPAVAADDPDRELVWSAPFEALSIGQRFTSPARRVGEGEVIGFCALTGDWHPQHCDARWAATGPFGERIAHGMLILSLAVGLVPFDPRRVIALRRVGDAVFKRPLRLEETVAVEGELTSLADVDEASGLAGLRLRIVNQEAALVCRAAVQVLWSRGALPASAAGRHWHEAVIDETPPGGYIPVPL